MRLSLNLLNALAHFLCTLSSVSSAPVSSKLEDLALEADLSLRGDVPQLDCRMPPAEPVTATLSVKRSKTGEIFEHWMLLVQTGSIELSKTDAEALRIPDAGSNSLAISGKGKKLSIKDNIKQFDLDKPLEGDIELGKVTTPDLEITENLQFRTKGDYVKWLKGVRSRKLSAKPTQPGGMCVDFIGVVLKDLEDKGLISAADLERWTAYESMHYDSVRKGTWDKIIAADGWADGIKH